MSSIENIIIEAKKIINVEEFNKYVNSREYEMKVTDVAKSYKITKDLYENLCEEVRIAYKENKELSFTIFFILFTMCRRQNYGDYLTMAMLAEDNFDEYELMKHIKLMAILAAASKSSVIYKAIKESSAFVSLKNDNCDYTNHVGALNVYTALICKYFEYHLDERKEPENIELLKKAERCIKKVIRIEMQEKGSPDAVYEKFYLNYGRILILLEQYNKGEEEITKAINLLSESTDRDAKVNEYNQYLLKASITHAYDLNEEKVKDLDQLKVSNYKSIALMTTLLGFLLGTINIFTTITDPFTLAMLMLGYAGLLLVLLGLILCGFTLTLHERKKTLLLYDVSLLIVGIIVFAVALCIIINKGMI